MWRLLMIVGFSITMPAWAKESGRTYTAGPSSPCEAVSVAHQPAADVHAEGSAPLNLDVMRIPVTVDLAEAFGITLPTGVELEPQVAAIEIHQDGKVTYNGQDISGSIEETCNKQEDNKDEQKSEDSDHSHAQ